MRARKFIASLAVGCACGWHAASCRVCRRRARRCRQPADADGNKTATSSAADSVSDESASDAEATTDGVEVSREGSAALKDGASFAIGDFSRAQKGSNRAIDGTYYGLFLPGRQGRGFIRAGGCGR